MSNFVGSLCFYLVTVFAFNFGIRQKLLPDLRLGLGDAGRVIGARIGSLDAQLLDVVGAVDLELHLVEVHDEEEDRVVSTDAAEVASLLKQKLKD